MQYELKKLINIDNDIINEENKDDAYDDEFDYDSDKRNQSINLENHPLPPRPAFWGCVLGKMAVASLGGIV